MDSTISPLEPQAVNIEVRDKFIKDLNGTSLEEVVLFSIHLPLFTFLAIFLELCLLNKLKINVYRLTPVIGVSATVIFVVEFCTIAVPVLLILTVFSDYAHLTLLFVLSIIFLRIIYCVSSPDEFVQYWKFSATKAINLTQDLDLLRGKHPFVTYFRSLTFLATAISILGVDFHLYPRRFAKTETFGISIMDLGVGMFITSTALVKKSLPFDKGLKKNLIESIVFLFLGVIRCYFIQRFAYQSHITEYGVHWNFFITLGLLKPISYLIQTISGDRNVLCGLILVLTNQYFISTSLESYVIGDKERENWIDANREGLVSLTGFICIYLFGCSIAKIYSSTEVQQGHIDKVKTVGILFVLSILALVATYCCDIYYIKVSRRLANLPYVLCVVSVTLVLLLVSLIVELFVTYFLPIQPHFKSKLYYMLTPALLESINCNGLLFFLITNLFTGFLNILIDLYSLKAFSGLLLLITYMIVSCVAVFNLYFANVEVKANFRSFHN